ncbi:MAG: hypothetical protein WC595_04990 [Candidatus Nanoarchaeia archaeon]
MKSTQIPKEADRLIEGILMGERNFENRVVERYDFSVHPHAPAVQDYLAKEMSADKLRERPFNFYSCDLTRVGIPFLLGYSRFSNSILFHVRFHPELSELTGATFRDCVLKDVELPYRAEGMQTGTSILTKVRTPECGEKGKANVSLLDAFRSIPVARSIGNIFSRYHT